MVGADATIVRTVLSSSLAVITSRKVHHIPVGNLLTFIAAHVEPSSATYVEQLGRLVIAPIGMKNILYFVQERLLIAEA